jgi:hypothetical protein
VHLFLFYPGLRAAGVAEPGAEPTHPEGQKDKIKKNPTCPVPLLPLLRKNHGTISSVSLTTAKGFARPDARLSPAMSLPSTPVTLAERSEAENWLRRSGKRQRVSKAAILTEVGLRRIKNGLYDTVQECGNDLGLSERQRTDLRQQVKEWHETTRTLDSFFARVEQPQVEPQVEDASVEDVEMAEADAMTVDERDMDADILLHVVNMRKLVRAVHTEDWSDPALVAAFHMSRKWEHAIHKDFGSDAWNHCPCFFCNWKSEVGWWAHEWAVGACSSRVIDTETSSVVPNQTVPTITIAPEADDCETASADEGLQLHQSRLPPPHVLLADLVNTIASELCAIEQCCWLSDIDAELRNRTSFCDEIEMSRDVYRDCLDDDAFLITSDDQVHVI